MLEADPHLRPAMDGQHRGRPRRRRQLGAACRARRLAGCSLRNLPAALALQRSFAFASVATCQRCEHWPTLPTGPDSAAGAPDLNSLWEEHIATEFAEKCAKAAVATMVPHATVNHVPVMTGRQCCRCRRCWLPPPPPLRLRMRFSEPCLSEWHPAECMLTITGAAVFHDLPRPTAGGAGTSALEAFYHNHFIHKWVGGSAQQV